MNMRKYLKAWVRVTSDQNDEADTSCEEHNRIEKGSKRLVHVLNEYIVVIARFVAEFEPIIVTPCYDC